MYKSRGLAIGALADSYVRHTRTPRGPHIGRILLRLAQVVWWSDNLSNPDKQSNGRPQMLDRCLDKIFAVIRVYHCLRQLARARIAND